MKTLNDIEQDLSSDKNTPDSLTSCYLDVVGLVSKHSEYATDGFRLLALALSSDANDPSSLSSACEDMARLAEAHPEYAKTVARLLTKAMASNKNNGHSLGAACIALGAVVKANPVAAEVAVNAFDKSKFFEKVAQAYNEHDLCANEGTKLLMQASDSLSEMLKSHVQNEDMAWDVYARVVSSPYNDDTSIRRHYDNVANVIKARSESVDSALPVYDLALSSPCNGMYCYDEDANGEALYKSTRAEGYDVLRDLAENCSEVAGSIKTFATDKVKSRQQELDALQMLSSSLEKITQSQTQDLQQEQVDSNSGEKTKQKIKENKAAYKKAEAQRKAIAKNMKKGNSL